VKKRPGLLAARELRMATALLGVACLALLPAVPQTLPRAASPLLLAGGKKSGNFASRERVSKTVSINRVVRRNYEILEEYEAGIALVGTEVKSCRDGKINLRDGFCAIKDGECWLENVNISPHGTTGSFFNHDERRRRRLLLNK
jgi:hypothetical protein